jgi:hypothetical protein
MLAVEAFRKNAVRSVVLIDENFAKLSDYGDDDVSEKFSESPKSRELYKCFESEHLICDIMNRTRDLIKDGKIAEKIRNSDLVILDLHLDGSDDISASSNILKALADSDHLAMVIVYTNEGDLVKVWRQLGGSLRRTPPPVNVADHEWEFALSELGIAIKHEGRLIDSLMDNFVRGERPEGEAARAFQELWNSVVEDNKTVRKYRRAAPCALAKRALELLGAQIDHGSPREVVGRHDGSSKPWLKAGNVFVVIAQKRQVNNNGTAPNELTRILDEAIKDWNPGLVRTLLAEIENTVGRRGFAFENVLSHDELTQVGWLWHAINERQRNVNLFGAMDNSPREILLNSTIDSIRLRLLNDANLADFTSRCLSTIEPGPHSDILSSAIKASGIEFKKEQTEREVIHSINRYLSSVPFAGTFITTGTVLRTNGRWWVCVEPACETVPQQAGVDVKFLSIKVLELHPTNDEALHYATHSHYIFVQAGQQSLCFDFRNQKSQLPVASTFYIPRHNQVRTDPTGNRLPLVTARRFDPKSDGDLIELFEWEIVVQLRYSYACRLLHVAGHHLSRIGVDFVDLPRVDLPKPE